MTWLTNGPIQRTIRRLEQDEVRRSWSQDRLADHSREGLRPFRAQVVAFMQANAITSANQVNLGFDPAIWAELDDALCLSALVGSSGDGATRLPFAVDGVRLQGSPGVLWAVRRPPLAQRPSLSLADLDCPILAGCGA